MKKTKLFLLGTLALTTAFTVSSCDQLQKMNTSSTKEAATETKKAEANKNEQMYVKSFDATTSYIKFLLNRDDRAFNLSLPTVTRYDFNAVLNKISNLAPLILEFSKEENRDQRLFDLFRSLITIDEEFQKEVVKYKADPKYVVNPNDSFNLEKAYLPDLILQLNAKCKESNGFNINLEEVKKQVIYKKDDKVIDFPKAEEEKIKSWNNSFTSACKANDVLAQTVKLDGFTMKDIKIAVEKVLEANKARDAKAAEEKAKAEAEKPKEEKAKKDSKKIIIKNNYQEVVHKELPLFYSKSDFILNYRIIRVLE